MVAAGQTVVMLTGGLDLSVGSVVLLSEVVVADVVVRHGAPVVLGIVAALAAGALVGVLNGLLIVVVRIEPILVTLGTLLLAAGAAKLLLGLTYIQIDNPFFDRLATTELPGGMPLMVVVMFGCYALVAVALYRTPFGKYVYAVGSNRRAASVAGLPVRSTQIAAYVLCATLAGVAGVLNAARLGLVSPNDGVGTRVRVDHRRARRRAQRHRRRRRTRRAHPRRGGHRRDARQLPNDPRRPAEPAAGDDRRRAAAGGGVDRLLRRMRQ